MRSWYLPAAAFAICLSVASCTSVPGSGEGIVPVSCDLLSSREASLLAPTRDTNPFLPIRGLVRGSPDEFAVVRIRLALAEPTTAAIEGSVRDESETDVAPLQTYSQMQRYWDTPTDVPNRDVVARTETLRRLYPHDLEFTAKQGRSEYVVVFKGKNPLPRPAIVTLSVALGGAEPQQFTFPLPPKEKGLFGS